jgi:hypothetical protein
MQHALTAALAPAAARQRRAARGAPRTAPAPTLAAVPAACRQLAGGCGVARLLARPQLARHACATSVRRLAAGRRAVPPAASSLAAAADDDAPTPPVAAPAVAEPEMPGWRRVVALTAVTMGICNIDRVLLSVAGVPLAAELGFDMATMGVLQSAYLWGYGLGQARARTRTHTARALYPLP